MSQLGDLIGRLHALITASREVSQTLQEAHDQVGNAASALHASTSGSSNPLVAAGLGQFRSGQEKIGEAQALLAAGAHTMEQYVQGPLLGGGGGGAPPIPPRAAGGSSGRRPVPPFVRHLAKRLPVRGPGDKTQLLAFTDEDSEPVAYTSGRRRDARDSLTPEFARRFVTRDHAEGHVAADMRRPGGPVHVTVVINNTPCPGDTGCDATIPHIIPKNATMTVYVTDGTDVHHYGTYTGTGEGIDDQPN